MPRAARDFLAGDAGIWSFAGLAVAIGGTTIWFGHTRLSEILLLALIALLLAFLGLRCAAKGTLLLSAVVLAAWLLIYAVLLLVNAGREAGLILLVLGFASVGVLHFRGFEF